MFDFVIFHLISHFFNQNGNNYDTLLSEIDDRRRIIIKIFLAIIGAILLLIITVHPGVPDKSVPIKTKLAVILPLIFISGIIYLIVW
ncbi:hypothetical protein COM55_26310 [Bacillus pseudomycoides]|nr:hypothetical protein COO02_27130 [Bacillus pseudomycoides]PEI85901.1 hypothetical protein CN679_24010 [Bacillus pseudomycoides]PEK71921.1 hypothetical protein CN590_06055 [Bacillus pseudomycoides]PEL31975.1 hypothetical protein CN608_06060 [Bacillus pseudomycoides]PGA90098.1 hypothetical protein COL91_15980 [Bacillus pseudomycoides]